jgi:hypothetical protein
MLAVILAAAATPALTPPARSLADDPCRAAAIHAAAPPPMSARKLGRLPPGVLQLAVDKRVGGCSVTVLPTRDARGQHHMLPRGRDVGLTPAERRSDRERRPERGR